MKNEEAKLDALIKALDQFFVQFVASFKQPKKARSKADYFFLFLWSAFFLFIIGAALYNNFYRGYLNYGF